jgi:ABC-type sugar transport system substrate-binding protein
MSIRGHLLRTSTAALLTLGLTASTAVASPSFAVASKLKSMLFVDPLPKNPQWSAGATCMAHEAKALGISYTETGPTTGSIDVATMVQEIQLGIADKYGAIITFPATNGFLGVISQARKAGIIFGTMFGGAGTDNGANFNVSWDYAQWGQLYVRAIAGRPGQQYVGLMAQAPTGAALAWTDGVRAAAKQYSNVHIVATAYTNDDASVALPDAEALLTAHPEINVLMSHMGTATAGASAAIIALHKVGKVVFIANGTPDGGAAGLVNGTVYAVLMSNDCATGALTARLAAAVAAGQKVPFQTSPGTVMATKATYKHYLSLGWL